MENHRTALITGASSGIGSEYARQLAKEGNNLIITARSEDKLDTLAQDLQSEYDISVEVIVADLASSIGIETLVEVIEETKDLYYLVNNAGFGIPDDFLTISRERHAEMISVHVTAVVELSHAALSHFMTQGEGVIITVSSVAAFIGNGVYSGTKQFQVNFSKKLHSISEGTNIRIQAVCPGYTYSGFHKTEEYKKRDLNPYEKIPKWLWLDPEYVVSTSLEKSKKRKIVVVPSFKYKLAIFLSKFGLVSR